MDLYPSPGGKTKESFINQAHEARNARELGRRRDLAATKIQAFFRGCLTRQKLKLDAIRELNEVTKLGTFASNPGPLLLLRRLLFICDYLKDRTTIDTLLQFIVDCPSNRDETSNHGNGNSSGTFEVTLTESKVDNTQSVNDDRIDHDSKSKPIDDINFIQLLFHDVKRESELFEPWVRVIAKLLICCINYMKDTSLSRLDSQHINLYLKIVRLFITDELLVQSKLDYQDSTPTNRELISSISNALYQRIASKTSDFFACTTELISDRAHRFRNDLKSSILDNYTSIILGVLDFELRDGRRTSINRTIVKMLSIPGYINNLNKFSPESMQLLIDKSFLQTSLTSLNSDHGNLKNITSTTSVFILANLIQLASMSTNQLSQEILSFVRQIMKLLESCQRNMLAVKQVGQKKKLSSTAAQYNLILGWITKESAPYHEDYVIKSQLGHLWSLSMLKILLVDLTAANQVAEVGTLSKSQESNDTNIKTPSNNKGDSHGESFCDISRPITNHTPATSPMSFFRRVVERATTTVSKTISSSNTKSSDSSRNSGLTKLMTPQTTRISSVCCMLYSSLKTFKALRQDILTSLCLHDYLLTNLWTFIRNLDSHNGLKTFLSHLTIYTKTSAPEFYILTLFCECASHLINILDDSELYERQQPFKIDDLLSISTFLNNFVYRIICNNLIPIENGQDIDPILQTTHKLLTDLYKRDCRRKFAPQDHWLIKDIKLSLFLKDLEAGKPTTKAILKLLPHAIPHKVRVLIFRRLVTRDKPPLRSSIPAPFTYITIHRSRIVEDGYQQLIRLPPHALKGFIRVRFINDFGLDEAGLDQDGVFKEFLEDTIKRVFDPALNLFCSTSEQCLYPSPTSYLHEDHLSLFKFVGKMLGKAVYEGIVVDVPFANFFLSRVLCQPQSPLFSPIDELPSLDPELYKSLTYIKHYEGDVGELDLTFSIDQDVMGKIETFELEPGGRTKPVTRENRVRYIHAVANFHMRTQIEKQTEAFVSGFRSIINLDWLSMFSASEFQRLISGDNSPIDLQDLRRNTRYFGGFHSGHRVICWLWDILEKDFTPEEHSLFLKFVTSCSKPPLLGFANLEPSFTIRCVEVSDDQDHGDTVGSVLRGFFAIRRSDPVDRLPTSATCFNVLKLPNYQRRSTLRDKLRYAISSNPGFELS